MASPKPIEEGIDLELTADEKAELDRRWAEHLAEPDVAVSLEDVLVKLRDPE